MDYARGKNNMKNINSNQIPDHEVEIFEWLFYWLGERDNEDWKVMLKGLGGERLGRFISWLYRE